MTRRVARVIVLDGDGRTFLLQGHDPARPEDPHFWFTPGGGCDPGESVADGARRELHEETGLSVHDLGAVVHTRSSSFVFDGEPYEQDEAYFAVRVEDFDVDATGWTALERRSLIGHRWWTLEELEQTSEVYFPEDLCSVLRRLTR